MLIATILAQAAVAASPPAAVAPTQQGVISYPTSFFAGQQVANANEMLARIPGFSLETGDSVRGFEGAAGNVIVDGQRPTSKTDTLDQILTRIPIAQIERIDIIRGGAPGIDMQGKTVIANVIKKSGASFRGLFAVANNHLWDGRNMHGMRVELSGGDGTRTWEALARYGYGNDDGGQFGPRVRFKPDGTILRQSRHQSEQDGLQQILSGAYSQPLAGGRISVNARLFWDSWKSEDTTTYTTPVDRKPDNIVSPYDEFQTELGARYNRDFGAKTRLELVGLRTDEDFHAFDLFRAGSGDTSEFRNKRDVSESIGRGVLKHQWSPKLSFEAGVEGALNKLDSRSSAFENGVAQTIPAADVTVEETRGEVFAKAIWRPASAWTIDSTLRFEASKISSDGDVVLEKKLQFLKPRVAVSWDVRPNTQLRARVERVVGQLDFDDFVAGSDFTAGTGVSAGNPDLNPQQAWVAEGAIEQRFWKSGAVTLTFRHSELKDVIDRGPVFLPSGQVFDQPTNIGDGTKDELIATFTVPSAPLGWQGGLLRGEINKRWSDVTDPTTFESRAISRLRPLEWEVHYSQDLPRYGLAVGADYFSGWSQTSYRYNFISDVKLHNGYLGTWLEKRLQPQTVLRLEVQNWTGRGIRIATKQYDGPRGAGRLDFTDDRNLKPGRSVFMRVRHTFGG
ncbi:MAG: TonB-dependent receptor [Alphaproteobacteria bacterium]|nr:TonB-dependent receptor [Alphaproteobacteria bacterium]MBU1515628.1 TonB-dependent receptor [Alphaproteobacteria bacterium]MBU2096963.1 TonB-dependent receptor [Alphaproteobacteria bacterium]MBU2149618.1 TonB-dependent receptor [Alphaproteobacteria bacterium]MBU2305646.1 TonB-dependent receptor [Alphaproteobacteria bacterium]